jgi:two-component sensor histidine kinase
MAAHTHNPTAPALSLAHAVVAASDAPLLLLDGELAVVAVSASFCEAFEIDPRRATGRSLFEMGAGEWDVPQLRSLLAATLTGQARIPAYQMDLKRPGREVRRLVLNARRLDYGARDEVWLVLAVADVTEARESEKLKDDLLREKAILLQELQHRVANSLQIVASVLMQSARKLPDQEARDHIYEAHQRVMSVAAVQKHLAATRLGDVQMRPYLTDLCRSIGASMIRDHDRLTLDVRVDDSVASAKASVSMGLIVTELVINALKHAFPEHRRGKILVGYSSHGEDWTLSVGDDGVGFPGEASKAVSGLGTSLVEALARQLDAHVHIKAGHPGTAVSVVHA